ncbi:MAG: DUF1214 domain-containing protein [Alphaproteobacteria bacterium]|nr:DUF1214 domain-containing protein [Alphaproteobacteria bacterium]
MISSLLIATGILLSPSLVIADESKRVTVFNFVRAETDMTLKRYVDQGAFGKFFHIRLPVPIDKQDVIRMNRDTLYSVGVFDLTEAVTIAKPDGGNRFQSMLVINQDHSMLPVEHGSGDFTLTKEKVGTRYVIVVFRTFANPMDAKDIEKANALQDQIKITQANLGSFEVPDWDERSLGKVRDAINVLADGITDTSGMFGDKDKLDPIRHLLGTAFGWGGNPEEAAVYVNEKPDRNDGATAYTVTVKDVPVDGFWSITIYNAKGYMEKNDFGAYSYNSVTAKPNNDGSTTIHFGGDPSNSNYLPIVEGWKYVVRLYQPRKEILDGSWKFPSPRSAK